MVFKPEEGEQTEFPAFADVDDDDDEIFLWILEIEIDEPLGALLASLAAIAAARSAGVRVAIVCPSMGSPKVVGT